MSRGIMFPDGMPFSFDAPRTCRNNEPDKPADTGRGVKIAEGIYASKPFRPDLLGKDALVFSSGSNGLSTYWAANCPCCKGEIRVLHFYTYRSPRNPGDSCMTKAKVNFLHQGDEADPNCAFKKKLPSGVELVEDVEYVHTAGNCPPWYFFRGLEPVLRKTLLANLREDADNG